MAPVQPPAYIQDDVTEHPADVFRRVIDGLITQEGIASAADLAVSAQSSPNMTVKVAAGHIFVKGDERTGQGMYHCFNDADYNVTISAAPLSLSRTDIIVARVLEDAEDSSGQNEWELAAIAGSAGGGEPATPDNTVKLAVISIAASASSITNANITDSRRRAAARGGIIVCTSGTRPAAPIEGTVVYETDTDMVQLYSGSAWVEWHRNSAWTSYSVTFSSSSGDAPLIGNGVVTGRYRRSGSTLHFFVNLLWGSTTQISVNTGPFRFNLPSGFTPRTTQGQIGQAFIQQSSGVLSGVAVIGATHFFALSPFETDSAVGNKMDFCKANFPGDWVAGDQLTLQGSFELVP